MVIVTSDYSSKPSLRPPHGTNIHIAKQKMNSVLIREELVQSLNQHNQPRLNQISREFAV